MPRYKLRTLLIVLALGPPVLAGTWFATLAEWSDELLLLTAVICAVPYWLGIAVLLAINFRRLSAWSIAGAAIVIWPALVLMSFWQLALVIPLWTVLIANRGDISEPISSKTAAVAFGSTVAFFLWMAAVVMMHG